ncbi:hypothetical protein QVD17_25283 [Tagetes erecta]|uniref:Uncharacterized protein n=1 Tax=Tagetes erecta TaxID=13708 RepID=A0AAD8NV18_TARER|nr:hypothetical protein QVD17_25283 [Tagetes erecta]
MSAVTFGYMQRLAYNNNYIIIVQYITSKHRGRHKISLEASRYHRWVQRSPWEVQRSMEKDPMYKDPHVL